MWMILWLACSGSSKSVFEQDLQDDLENSNTSDSEQSDSDGDHGEQPEDTPDEEIVVEPPIDPFPELDRDTHGLTNTSYDLEEVLEYGALENACALYAEFPYDETLKLRCGKSMFFYEGFGGIGIPQPLLDFVSTKFPDELGEGFEAYGMFLDPYSEEGRPIGYGQGAPLGNVETLAYSCASCHFGQLPDGRYSVGMGNYEYEAGKQFLALMLLPQSVMPGFNDDEHDPAALEIIQPLRQKLWDSPILFAQMGWQLLPLLWQSDMSAAELSKDVEGAYASWKAGTMDVFIPPLPIDDEVHIVSKIPSLWSIPTQEEQSEFDMPSAMLAWNGASPHLEHFVSGFLALGDSSTWTLEDVEPLIAYVESLSAPKHLLDLDENKVASGRQLFNQECLDCHKGFQGSGTEVFSFEEIGTDDRMMYILDPDLDGVSGLGVDNEPTHGIKAPRLTGVWAKTRLLHNGSVDSLDDLFCMNGERADDQLIFGNIGHIYGCDWSNTEKEDIIEFLKSI